VPADVEVHYFSLDAAPRLKELAGFLSADERERAARFRFDRDRDRYIVCRGSLRELLAARLRIAPASVQFVYGRFGKPAIDQPEIRFNVSHSHGMAMIALARSREVGCDIERIDPLFAGEKIPERFFSPYEVAALRALPAADQCDAFFRCWTRKEAYIKACGMGISLALDSFDVTVGPNQPPALLRGADGWSLRAIDAPPAGYAAAVVVSDAIVDQPPITMPTSSLISSMTKSGGAAANVSG
jgi:4'-phosphopantetheinyl transferase